jgi:hypothetical protein
MDDATRQLLEDDARVREGIVRLEFSVTLPDGQKITTVVSIQKHHYEDRAAFEDYVRGRFIDLALTELRP